MTFHLVLLAIAVLGVANFQCVRPLQSHVAHWKVSMHNDGNFTTGEHLPKNSATQVQLIDWKQWQSMREMRRDDLPPMLIVASEELASAKVEPYITKPPEKKEELPAEAYEEDDAHSFDKSNRADALTLNFNLPGGSLNFGSPKTTTEWSPPHADEVDKTTIIPSSSSPSSKGDSQLSTTTVTSSDTTPNADFTDENVVERTTTPLPSPPPPNIDLKHLPDMLQLFKQLAQLPVMLRSMGNGGEAVGVGHLSLDPPSFPSTNPLEANPLFSSFIGNGLGSPDLRSTAVFNSPDNGPALFGVPLQSSTSGLNTKLFSLKEYNAARSGKEFNTEGEPGNSDDGISAADSFLKPIVPTVTTFDSGKIRLEPEPTMAVPPEETTRTPSVIERRFRNFAGNSPSVGESDAPLRTPYSAPMMPVDIHNLRNKYKRRQDGPRFNNLSNLTVKEVRQLETIRQKLLNIEEQYSSSDTDGTGTRNVDINTETTDKSERNDGEQIPSDPSLMVYDHSTSTSEPLSVASAPSIRQLPSQPSANISDLSSDVLRDLVAIKDLPDLDELTKGMDLTLLHRPGGFAILKQQFIERLIQRSIINRRHA